MSAIACSTLVPEAPTLGGIETSACVDRSAAVNVPEAPTLEGIETIKLI